MRASLYEAVGDSTDDLVALDASARIAHPSQDDLATWTGSVVRGPDNRWYLYYSGVSRADDGRVQRIGAAVSEDLCSWHRIGAKPPLEADPTWYERLDTTAPSDEGWYEEAGRDPWPGCSLIRRATDGTC
ncbi:hypothetical protein AB5J52_42385 [Streptomyces sp. R39]|uniref:Glycosyl hydrolase family 32 N-terminal domain-containing protein n=1 Tax=Streptomyces sp. R39 TaxID=3238631 RepID=A0AB39R0S3_9ACTN